MKVCRPLFQVLIAACIAALNFFFAIGTFGQLFACADMWGKCTPPNWLTYANLVLTFPLNLVPLPTWFNNLSLDMVFAINAVVWGALAYFGMRLACHRLRT